MAILTVFLRAIHLPKENLAASDTAGATASVATFNAPPGIVAAARPPAATLKKLRREIPVFFGLVLVSDTPLGTFIPTCSAISSTVSIARLVGP